MSRRAILTLIGLLALAALAAALRLGVAPPSSGAAGFSLSPLSLPLDGFEWRIRGQRVACGVIVGAALAVAGAMLQALLRNPLAEPTVLGLTYGAGLGVVVSIYLVYLATGSLAQYVTPVAPAVIGACAALAVVYALGQRGGFIEPISLILVGVVVSVTCGAGIVFVQNLLPIQGWALSVQWTMGALRDDLSWPFVAWIGALVAAGSVLGAWLGPAMDAATLPDDEAKSVGVRLERLRLALFLAAGAMTAGAVLLAGPIGFVGLVCPHAVRLLAGPSHRPLIIGSAFAGAALIVAADALVRLVNLGGGRMPLGVLTALAGGPVFILLLRRSWREASL